MTPIRGALFGALLAAVGCVQQPASTSTSPAPVAPAPAEPVTHIGTLDVVIGDPSTGGSERIAASLVLDDGRRLPLVISRQQLDRLGVPGRTPGARVRVEGMPTATAGGALQVTRIELAPPSRPPQR